MYVLCVCSYVCNALHVCIVYHVYLCMYYIVCVVYLSCMTCVYVSMCYVCMCVGARVYLHLNHRYAFTNKDSRVHYLV